jgi:hypothetical protein
LAEALLAKEAVDAGCQQSQLLLRATLNGLWPIQRPSACGRIQQRSRLSKSFLPEIHQSSLISLLSIQEDWWLEVQF